jgi:hypothetical protein
MTAELSASRTLASIALDPRRFAMNTTTSRPDISRRVKPRRGQALAAIGALLVTGGFALAELTGPDESSPSERVTPTSAGAWPGHLTAAERAAVVAALGSRDAGTRRRAEHVAEGRAGVTALADPATLHHYGVDTSAVAQPNTGTTAADRFHYR